MKNPMNKRNRRTFKLLVGALLSAFGVLLLPSTQAAPTVDQSPLTVQAPIPPNIVLMLDDSGSMAWNFMPDICFLNPGAVVSSSGPYVNCSSGLGLSGQPVNAALINSAVNGVYYNPTVTYTAPVKANGTRYSNATGLTSAWPDGFVASTATTPVTVNLTTYANASTYGGSGSGYTYSGGTYETDYSSVSVGQSNIAFSVTMPLTTTTTTTQPPTCSTSGYSLTGSGSSTACTKVVTPTCASGTTYNASLGTCGATVSTPSCPSGYSPTGSGSSFACTATQTPTCATGTTYSTSTGICLATTSTPTCSGGYVLTGSGSTTTCAATVTPTCASGSSYSSSTGTCVATVPTPTCSGGYVLTGSGSTTTCTATVTPTCASGSSYSPSTGTCVATAPTPTCSGGYALTGSGSTTICKSTATATPSCGTGTTYNSSTGLCAATVSNPCSTKMTGTVSGGVCVATPVCSKGTYNGAGGCSSGGTVQCTSPYTLNGAKTQCSTATSCATGTSLVGSACVANTPTPTCGSGYSLTGSGSTTTCSSTATQTPTCASGTTYTASTGLCVANNPTPTCAGGYTATGSGSSFQCVKTATPTCASGTTFSSSTGLCIANSPTPICAGGYTATGSGASFQCLKTTTPTCASGTTYSAASGICFATTPTPTCGSGYNLTGSGATTICFKSATPTCASGTTYDSPSGSCVATVSTPTCPGGTLSGTGGTTQCTLTQTPACTTSGYTFASSTGLCTQTTSSTSNYNFFQFATGGSNTVSYVASTAQGCATLANCYLENDITGAAAPIGVPVGQNIANWFAYYHTRILMVKSGLLTAFSSIDPTIRVGYGSINGNNKSALPSSTGGTYPIAAVKTFDTGAPTTIGGSGTQRNSFWSWVVGESPTGGTPLRGALNAVGQYYMTATPWATSATDSTELACRQSYTILTTDGFWNDSFSSVGDVDGTAGSAISNPNGNSYTYAVAPPFADSAQTQTVSHTYTASCPTGYSGPNSSSKCTKSGFTSVNPTCSGTDTRSGSTCTHVDSTGVTYSNTLADVAMKYWNTDLRPTTTNEVPTSSADPAYWQHMTTFTLGLGFTPTGITPATSIADIFTWASGGGSPSGNNGLLTWPQPASNSINNIADLAHAAVNGHGGFYSATSPQAFSSGIADAINRVEARVGTSASLAANSTKLTTGTVTYQAYYYSGIWVGDLRAYVVNPSTGAISASASWSAAAAMPAYGSRKVYTYNGSQFVQFSDPANLSTAQQNALGSTTANQQSVINYVLGDSSNEQRNNGVYRNRRNTDQSFNPLGDVINSAPVYAGAPDPNLYTTQTFTGASTYGRYAVTQAAQTPVVWIAANDGILHGFRASDGVEIYGYLPGSVITSGLANISNPSYGTSASVPHQSFNDGQLAIYDVYQTSSSSWRTILVGSTGRGTSKTVYALDVTNPGSVTPLWERNASDGLANSNYIGQVTGAPVIGQTSNGVWSVLMGNGYNSTAGTAALLQFNVFTGALTVHTTNASTNNGLAAPGVWIPDVTNGISTIAYAGDALGNVWSFDLTNSSSTGQLLFTAKDASNNVQPITDGITLGLDPVTSNVWVYFGTGRYLTQSDLSSVATQTWYGIIVQSSTASLVSNLSNGRNALVQRQILAQTAPTATTAGGRVITPGVDGDMAGKSGWYLDLLAPPVPGTAQGERMVVPSQFQGSMLIGTSLIPVSSDPCSPSGTGYTWAVNPFSGTNPSGVYFDLNNDGAFNSSDMIAVTINGQTILLGSAAVYSGSSPNGSIFVGNVMLTSNAGGGNGSMNINPPASALKRLSWRELVAH